MLYVFAGLWHVTCQSCCAEEGALGVAMAALSHASAGLCSVVLPGKGKCLLHPLTGELVPIGSGKLLFDEGGWGFVVCQGDGGTQAVKQWCKAMLTRHAFQHPARGLYLTLGTGAVAWLEKLQKEHQGLYLSLQVGSRVGALTVRRLGAPLQGASWFWELRNFQEPRGLDGC